MQKMLDVYRLIPVSDIESTDDGNVILPSNFSRSRSAETSFVDFGDESGREREVLSLESIIIFGS